MLHAGRSIIYNWAMKRRMFVGMAAAMWLTAGTAPPASEVMDAAQQAAAAQHKSIFLIFQASW